MCASKALIDIGSNSVRLAVFAGGQMVYKGKITSQLGRGLASSGKIVDESMERTLSAVGEFCKTALKEGVQKADIYAFATATVRRAKNGNEFCDKVFERFGLRVDVVSESEEADLALEGALGRDDGAVLDVGGASSELIVRAGGAIKYSKSLPLGAVVLHDEFGADLKAAWNYVSHRVKEYGDVAKIQKLTCVGGTATTIAKVVHLLDKSCDGETVKRNDLTSLNRLFETTSAPFFIGMGVDEPRAKILPVGTLLITAIIDYLGVDSFVATHNDNLLGYYRLKVKGGENG